MRSNSIIASFLRKIMTFRQFSTKRNMLLAASVLGVFVAVGATALAAYQSAARLPGKAAVVREEESRVLPVRTARLAAQESYETRRWYTGKIEARRSGELGFEHAGLLQKVLVEEGETVRAGEILAELDTRALRNQRKQLVAKLENLNAVLAQMLAGPRVQEIDAQRAVVQQLAWQMDLARRQYERRKTLHAKRVIAQEDLDELESEFQVLRAKKSAAQSQLDELLAGTRKEEIDAQRASVAQLQAQIQAVDIDLDKSRLIAPYSGVISARYVDEGTVVAVGQSIVALQEGGGLEARIGMPPSALTGLEIGGVLDVEVGERTYPARVKAFLPVLDSTTRTVEVLFELQGNTAFEQTGKLARVAVVERVRESGFWLPAMALVKGERGLWGCYVLAPDVVNGAFRVERRIVEVLHLDGERVYVRGALLSGEALVTGGAHRTTVGQLVKPVFENI